MPIEIKEKIYECTLHNEEQFEAPLQLAPCDELDQYPPSHICFPNLPNMCYINKAERSIAMLVLFRNSGLRLTHSGETTTFMERSICVRSSCWDSVSAATCPGVVSPAMLGRRKQWSGSDGG
jgi:hypothetical protein